MYHETSLEGPEAKKVKLSDIHEALKVQFPSTVITSQCTSRAIQSAFPNAQKKRLGKERNTFVVGVEQSLAQQPTHALDVHEMLAAEQFKNQQLTVKVKELEVRVHELECQVATVHEVECQGRQLECQAAAGTQESLSPPVFDNLFEQIDSLLQRGDQVLNGPDTIEHMDEFSLSGIASEFQSLAPDVYSLFEQLGDVHRHSTSEEEVTLEQRKMVTSLSTLLNARSRQAKGLQLLLSLMLVARATSKLVHHLHKKYLMM